MPTVLTKIMKVAIHFVPCKYPISCYLCVITHAAYRPPKLRFLGSAVSLIVMIHMDITLGFIIDNAFPEVLPANISWKFRRNMDNTTFAIPEMSDSKYGFVNSRKTLVILNFSLEDAGQYTITATNEAGADNFTVTRSIG